MWCVLENEEGEEIERIAFHFSKKRNLEECKSDILTRLPGDSNSYGFEFCHERDRSTRLTEGTPISTIETTSESRLVVKITNVAIKKQKLLGTQ